MGCIQENEPNPSYPAFVVYDLIITLPREIKLFWTRDVRILSAVLYFSNKYSVLLSAATPIIKYVPMSDPGCNGMVIVGNVIAYFCLVPPAGTQPLLTTFPRFISGGLKSEFQCSLDYGHMR